MKKIILLILFISSLFSLEKISIQLNWKYQFEFAGFIMAKEKGFYKEVGLDVELKPYKIGLNIIDEVISKRATFGISNSYDLLSAYLNNKPVVLHLSIFKKSALVIVSKPYIKKPKDLINKTLMATKADINELSFMFDVLHIDMNRINVIPHNFKLDKFINNEIDALSAYKTDQLYKLNKLNIKYNIIDPSDYGLYTLQSMVFSSKDVAKNSELVCKFHHATKKGWEYALSHVYETIEILSKKYVKDISKDELLNEAKALNTIILPYSYEIGSIDRMFLEKQFKYLSSKYKIYKSLDEFLFTYYNNKVSLTKKEKDMLKKNEFKICYDKKFYPLSLDILKLISKKIHLKYKLVEINNNNYKLLLKNNKCDIVASAVKENSNIIFSKPYFKDNLVVVTRLNTNYFSSLSQVKDKLFVVNKDAHKNVDIVDINEIKTTANPYKLILEGKIFGYITTSFNANSEIIKNYSDKLKIMTNIDTIPIAFATNNIDLVKILDKSIERISQEDLLRIYDKYYNVKQSKINWDVVIYLIILFLVILAIVGYFLEKEKKLNIEINKLNQDLELKVKKAIEETRKTQQELIAQSRFAQMGEMISMIAHQWRQPLSSISAISTSLRIKAELNKLSKNRAIELSDRILEITKHLSNTIDDFRNFFKPNKEKVKTSLSKMVKESLSIIEVTLKNHSIDFIVECNDNNEIETYENEIKQVILNIIKNAHDILIEKSIKEPKIYIKCYDKTIVIKDNGGGIDEKIINKIFDPYFSTKNKNGTGLGLYMSKIIIEEHCKGKLEVKNYSEGAIFKIIL